MKELQLEFAKRHLKMTRLGIAVISTISSISVGLMYRYGDFHPVVCFLIWLCMNIVGIGIISLVFRPMDSRYGATWIFEMLDKPWLLFVGTFVQHDPTGQLDFDGIQRRDFVRYNGMLHVFRRRKDAMLFRLMV